MTLGLVITLQHDWDGREVQQGTTRHTCWRRPDHVARPWSRWAQVYAKLRKESAIGAGMPIAVRHLESMIRMSEAHAKMHLRKQVSDADIDTAVRCVPIRLV